jgi:hypothetical protein
VLTSQLEKFEVPSGAVVSNHMVLGLGTLLFAVLGCAEEDDTALVDTGLCADVPLLTYANFGRGYLTEYCQGCHASTTLDRHGAPETVTFDTLELAWGKADRILERSLGGTMPPSGGVSDDDLTMMEWWLTCGEEGL